MYSAVCFYQSCLQTPEVISTRNLRPRLLKSSIEDSATLAVLNFCFRTRMQRFFQANLTSSIAFQKPWSQANNLINISSMNSIFLDLISIHTWSLMSMVLESYEVLVVVQSNLKCCCTITSFENHQNLKSSGTIKTDITRDILKLRSFENMSSHLSIVFNSCHWWHTALVKICKNTFC